MANSCKDDTAGRVASWAAAQSSGDQTWLAVAVVPRSQPGKLAALASLNGLLARRRRLPEHIIQVDADTPIPGSDIDILLRYRSLGCPVVGCARFQHCPRDRENPRS